MDVGCRIPSSFTSIICSWRCLSGFFLNRCTVAYMCWSWLAAHATFPFFPKHVPISGEGAPVVCGGWPAADRGRGAACCYNYTPHSGASSLLLGGSTHTKHSHSVIQYQGVQGTCIPALQALSLNTFDRIDSITYDLWQRQLASTNMNPIHLILRLPPFALLYTSFHSGGSFKFRLTLNLNLNPDLTLSLKILHFEWQSATKAR